MKLQTTRKMAVERLGPSSLARVRVRSHISPTWLRPGWFVFDAVARGMATDPAYECEIVTKDGTGKELNHTARSPVAL